MKVFNYQGNPVCKDDKWVAIDPAVRDLGVVVYQEGLFRLGRFQNSSGVLFKAFPELFTVVRSAVEKFVNSVLWTPNTNVLLEYTFLSGQFSVGLSMFNSLLIDRLLGGNLCKNIFFVPPRLGSFFLQKKSTKKSEHVSFVKTLFSLGKRRISSHEADCFLMLLLILNEEFKNRFDISSRASEYEIIKLEV